MTDQTPPPSPDWRDQRREERWQRHVDRWGPNGAWIGGGLLIVLGVIFLAQNLGAELPENWWAIFVLVPAAFSFSGAWSLYVRNDRKMTTSVRGALTSGAILTLLAVLLFFGIDFGKYWPVVLILLGVAVIGGSAIRR